MSIRMSHAEQAMAWFTRSREGELSAEERRQFVDWLTESPVHVREYLDTTRIWGALQSEAVWPSGSREEFLNIVSETVQGTAMAPLNRGATALDAAQSSRAADLPARRPRRRLLYAIAASVMTLASATL